MAKNESLSSSSAAAAVATATTTAAILATNIEFIKSDILEIKQTLKEIVLANTTRIDTMETKLDTLARIVYIGVGISIALSVILKVFVK